MQATIHQFGSLLIDMLADNRTTTLAWHIGWHILIDKYIGRVSAEFILTKISVACQVKYRLIYWSSVGQSMSTDFYRLRGAQITQDPVLVRFNSHLRLFWAQLSMFSSSWGVWSCALHSCVLVCILYELIWLFIIRFNSGRVKGETYSGYG